MSFLYRIIFPSIIILCTCLACLGFGVVQNSLNPIITPTPTEIPSRMRPPTEIPSQTQSPTKFPSPIPTIKPTSTSFGIKIYPTNDPDCQECSLDFYNCSDFPSQLQAQECYNFCNRTTTEKDIHQLDKDNNGIACENLP